MWIANSFFFKTTTRTTKLCYSKKGQFFFFSSLGFDGNFESLIYLLRWCGPLQILFGVRASWLLVQGTASPDRKKTWKGQDRDLDISFVYLNRERERGKGREREWNVNVSLLSLRKYVLKTTMNTNTHIFICLYQDRLTIWNIKGFNLNA